MRNFSTFMKQFTLIEMLVVIAIIGILSAMMMGGISSALESSRLNSCASNLRQIATATIIFENNFNKAANLAPTGSINPNAHSIDPFICLWDASYLRTEELLQCPGETALNIVRGVATTGSIAHYATSAPSPLYYSINNNIGTPSSYAFRWEYTTPFPKDVTFLLGDSSYDTTPSDTCDQGTRNHNGPQRGFYIANVAYIDGHVEKCNQEGMISGINYNPWKFQGAIVNIMIGQNWYMGTNNP